MSCSPLLTPGSPSGHKAAIVAVAVGLPLGDPRGRRSAVQVVLDLTEALVEAARLALDPLEV